MPEVADLLTPALVVALFTWLRNDVRRLHDRVDGTNARIDVLAQRFDGVSRDIGELRERMARLEGSLEGFLAGFRDRDAS